MSTSIAHGDVGLGCLSSSSPQDMKTAKFTLRTSAQRYRTR